MSTNDEDEDICDVLQVATTAIQALSTLSTTQNEIDQFNQPTSRIPSHNSSLSEQQFTAELLVPSSTVLIRECLHMLLEVFQVICDRLWEKNLLRDTRYTKVEYQLLIFLHITTSGASNLVAQERFIHSSETISRLFKKVLHAIHMLPPRIWECLHQAIQIYIWYRRKLPIVQSFSHFSKIVSVQSMGLLFQSESVKTCHLRIELARDLLLIRYLLHILSIAQYNSRSLDEKDPPMTAAYWLML